MKISLCVVIFLLIVFSSSCSQQNVVENVMEIDQHSLSYYVGRGISSSSITVSEDDAMYVAYSFMKRGQHVSRKTCSQVTPLISVENQTIGYVVNFSEGGYCIVASSKDSYPILAYSDEGRFDVSNVEESGVSVWLNAYIFSQQHLSNEEREQNRMQWSVYEKTSVQPMALDDPEKTAALNKRLNELHEEFEGSGDMRPLFAFKGSGIMPESLYNLFKSKGGSEDYTIVVWESEDKGVKIPTMLNTEWHQNPPFGEYADNKIAGCTVIAGAQIMNYYRYPTYYNWDAMPLNEYKNSTLYQFIRDVCDKFDVEYKQNATSSNIKKVEKGLEEFGFRVEAKKEYAGNLVRTLKIPIYERGENSAGDGHAWVVDGYHERDIVYYFTVEYLRGSNGSYYYERDKTKYLAGGNPSPAIIASQHYNWGWANEGTTKNGWFYSPEIFPDDLQQLIIIPSY
jgi:hypothetical protein bfra3_23100